MSIVRWRATDGRFLPCSQLLRAPWDAFKRGSKQIPEEGCTTPGTSQGVGSVRREKEEGASRALFPQALLHFQANDTLFTRAIGS